MAPQFTFDMEDPRYDARAVADVLLEITMGIWYRWGQTEQMLRAEIGQAITMRATHIQIDIRREAFLRHVTAWSTGSGYLA